jgi:hypothetical protein
MSTLATTNLKNPSSGSDNIVLGTDGSTRVSTLADSAGANTSTPAEIASGRAKAWVNFNGTGTVAIRASYNVSSITDNGTGDYTVNFATALADANYSAVITGQPNTADGIAPANGQCTFSVVGTTGSAALPSASGFRVWIGYAGTNPRDVSGLYAAVFR